MSDVIRIIEAMVTYVPEKIIVPVIFYLVMIVVLCSMVTKNLSKIIIADLLWGILFFSVTAIFFAHEIASWGSLSGDNGMIVVVLFPFHFIVNGIFLLLQGLLTRSTNNQENRQKMLKQKKICFLIHIIILFGLYFFIEVAPFFVGNGRELDWTFYITAFVIVSYLLYDYLFSKITKSQEPAIFSKIINRINDLFPDEKKKE